MNSNGIQILENRAAYSEVIRTTWKDYNRERGLSTTNLCQCVSHYKYDTLLLPNSCKNSKSFKKLVLGKLATKERKNIAPLKRSLKKDRQEIEILESELARLKSRESQTNAEYERINSLVSNLKSGVTAIADKAKALVDQKKLATALKKTQKAQEKERKKQEREQKKKEKEQKKAQKSVKNIIKTS